MDKFRDIDMSRLQTAIQRSRYVLRRYRSERREAVRKYAGNHWGADEEAVREKRVFNFLSQYVSIVGKKLVAKEPRVMFSTFNVKARPVVEKMQRWANDAMVQMNLADTLQRVVVDALFAIGIAKVALATPAESASRGWNLRTGSAFVERVDLDDFVYDIHARDLQSVGFAGHRYRVPLEVVRDSTLYGPGRKDLMPSDDGAYNQDGDQRVGVLGRGQVASSDRMEWEDHVDLWEIYVPRKKLVLTFGSDSQGNILRNADPLRVQEWIGPDHGPYHFLCFGIVPGNAMPKAPIMDLLDLDELLNNSWRKLGRQAQRHKEVVMVRGQANEDGTRVVSADDGAVIKVDDPEGIVKVEFGGPNPQLFAFAMQTKDAANNLAGNLETMGGLSAQAKTARQEALLNENSSATIADLQGSTTKWVASVCKALAWYWHHDPQHVMQTVYSPPGVPDVQRVLTVTPEDRTRISWEDIDIQVDPYSLAHSTPQSRGAALDQVMMQVVMPLLPVLQQQGVTVDLAEYLRLRSKYLDMPDLPVIVTVTQPMVGQEGGDHGGMPGPQQPGGGETPRVREAAASEKTQAGQDAVLKNTLMGGGVQPAEAIAGLGNE